MSVNKLIRSIEMGQTQENHRLHENKPVLRRFPCSALISVMMFLLIAPCTTYANLNDAQLLQDRAVARIDRYLDHVRRTFDQNALSQELIEARRELDRSVELFRAVGAQADAARSMLKLGDVGRYRSDWDIAIQFYGQAAREARIAGAAEVECKALIGNARAHLYGKKGAGRTLELVRQALSLTEQIKDPGSHFDAWDMMAQVQITEGDYVGAADSMNRAFAVAGAMQDDKNQYAGYLDRADVYQHFAEKCGYERNFQYCLDAVERARRDYASASEAAKRLGWHGLAKQAREFITQLEDRKRLIQMQRHMHEMVVAKQLFSPATVNDVMVSEQFTTGAIPQLPGVLAWIEKSGGLPPLIDARGAYVRGLLSEADGQRDEATTWYLRAVELLEQDRRQLYDERARGGYVEDKVEFYYGAMLHLLDRRRYKEAFDVMERSRSRVMLDLLATKSLTLSSPEERSLYGRMLQLRSETAQIQTCLFAARDGKGPDPSCRLWHQSEPTNTAVKRGAAVDDVGQSESRVDSTKLEAVLKDRQAQYNAILNRMEKSAPQLAQLVTSQPAALEAVSKVLARDGSELLTYVVLENQLIIWLIGPDSVQVRSIFLPRSSLKEKIERIRRSLVDPKQPYDQKTAHELYLYLIAPMLPWIKSEHLVIVPHEDLHYLPFQALQTKQGDRYLGELYQLSYAPSATVMVSLAGPAALARPEVLAVADPSLRYAPSEVRAVKEGFSGTVVADSLVNEADAKKLMVGKGLVHLAVHGTFAADEPLLSYLNLKEGEGEDGKLTAAEMYGLSLDVAKLVVLSACETGTVRATHANEVLGMVRGLLFAGADALLLSAWKIDDQATSQWMQAFYAAARIKPLAAAAREAIRDLKAKSGYQHPYYWSPFLLIGR
ncbi:MAG: CHAT domain-containing protein [Nitrospira sp.]